MYFTYRTKRFKVEQDPHNLILLKHSVSKKDGTDKWTIVGYYSSFPYLVRRLLKEGVFSAKESKDMLSSFNAATKDLSKQLEQLIKAPNRGLEDTISEKMNNPTRK